MLFSSKQTVSHNGANWLQSHENYMNISTQVQVLRQHILVLAFT